MRNSFAKVVFSKAESKLNPITLGIANPKRVARIKPKYPKLKSFLWLNTKESILNKYLICKHNKFKDPKIVNILKNSRGLIYFLSGCEFNQKKLEEFIKFCRLNEDANGFLTQSFFKIIKKTKAKFISGPFTQMIFDIIEDRGGKLKVLLNNANMTISKSSKNLLYSYI